MPAQPAQPGAAEPTPAGSSLPVSKPAPAAASSETAPALATSPDATAPGETPPGASGPEPSTAKFEVLPIEGFEPAMVWAPKADSPIPVFVVAHGSSGSPDWHCGHWQQVVQDKAFLLCLRGQRKNPDVEEYFFPDPVMLGKLMAAALHAFDVKFAERVSPTGGIYIGYSQGAAMGTLMIEQYAKRFPQLLLLEGGHQTWSAERAKSFRAKGGRAVFIACGTVKCDENAKQIQTWFEQANLATRYSYAEGAGHLPQGPVAADATEGLAWLRSL